MFTIYVLENSKISGDLSAVDIYKIITVSIEKLGHQMLLRRDFQGDNKLLVISTGLLTPSTRVRYQTLNVYWVIGLFAVDWN